MVIGVIGVVVTTTVIRAVFTNFGIAGAMLMGASHEGPF
jgi:hypothetical protein